MCKIHLCIYVFEDDKYNEITKKYLLITKDFKNKMGANFGKKSLSV